MAETQFAKLDHRHADRASRGAMKAELVGGGTHRA